MENYIGKIRELVLEGEDEEIVEMIDEAVEAGVSPKEIVSDALIEGMNQVGPLMASGELYVPEVLLCAETMQLGLKHLKPQLQAGDVTTLGKIVIGTVEGDLHDIGKDLVAMMLESSGFEVVNIGVICGKQSRRLIVTLSHHKPCKFLKSNQLYGFRAKPYKNCVIG